MKRKYSVLLLYPDYMSSNYGHETFMAHVESASADKAIRNAQSEAAEENEVHIDGDPSDFHCLLCSEGHHFDLNTHNK